MFTVGIYETRYVQEKLVGFGLRVCTFLLGFSLGFKIHVEA